MYNYILELSLVVSLAIMVYLLARAVPRISSEEKDLEPFGVLDRLIAKLPLQKVDRTIHSYWEKFLRKIKIVVLKFDNWLSTHLHRARKKKDQPTIKDKLEQLSQMSESSDVTPTQQVTSAPLIAGEPVEKVETQQESRLKKNKK